MNGDLQGAFRALADPTRRQILVLLGERDMTIGEVVERFDITRGAIKKHLNVLEQGALITVRASGRERINRLEPRALTPVAEWLDYFSRFWDERLEGLKQTIDNDQRSKH